MSLNIGVTMAKKKLNLWNNGVSLNVIYFIKLLKNSKKKYNISVLNLFDADLPKNNIEVLKDIDIKYYKKCQYKNYDIIFLLGGLLPDEFLINARKNNVKIIYYKMGNDYIINTEKMLFKKDSKCLHFTKNIDELWYIPQQHENNFGFYATMHGIEKPIMVPFCWHHCMLDKDVNEFKQLNKFKPYKPNKKKRLGCFAPNINTVKLCVIPALIAEESYKTNIGKERIENIKLTNALIIAKNNLFKSIINSLALQKEKKLSVEGRYRIVFMLNEHIDVVLCHQLNNPLNYVYLDTVYLGYPLLHNAPLCKDLGYYYHQSDTKEGGRILNYILENHDKHINQYIRRNNQVLYRYNVDNPKLVKTYDQLISDIYTGRNHLKTYNKYTNLYDNLYDK